MITILSKTACCGCSACAQCCPKGCITMIDDSEGFLYPLVDKENCIDCHICENVCPLLKSNSPHEPLLTYAAINKDEKTRQSSSSGGIFSLLAEKIILNNGIVFGAKFDDDFQVCHDFADTIAGIVEFRGSKYVQSKIGEAYKKCENFLKARRQVLFSGTPCQIGGLKHFLRKDYDNLFTVDVVCHGVPSPKVWHRYLKEIVGTKRILNCSMRNKENGWKRSNFTLDYGDMQDMHRLSSWHHENVFMEAFLKNMILRPSCYNCRFRNFRSHSDITIADFWGVQKIIPEMDDDRGTSLVMVNTEKGCNILPIDGVRIVETSFVNGLRSNPSIAYNHKPWPRREKFFNTLDDSASVIDLIREMLKPTFIMQIKNVAHRIVCLLMRVVYSILKKQNIEK